MKKKSFLLTCLLFFSSLSMITFSSCDSDTNSYINVTVVDETTKTPMSHAKVTVFMEGGSVESQTGYTNAMGTYLTGFRSPAIVTIYADYKLEDQSTDKLMAYRSGKGSARLKEGETVEATITIPSTVYYHNI